MDFGKAFTFMFEDPDWLRKLGIGTWSGWSACSSRRSRSAWCRSSCSWATRLDVLRNVMDGKQYPLPEWEDWGGFLARGFKLVGRVLRLGLPAILVAIPLGIGAALTDQQRRRAGEALGALLIICGSCLITVCGALFLP